MTEENKNLMHLWEQGPTSSARTMELLIRLDRPESLTAADWLGGRAYKPVYFQDDTKHAPADGSAQKSAAYNCNNCGNCIACHAQAIYMTQSGGNRSVDGSIPDGDEDPDIEVEFETDDEYDMDC